MPIEESEPKGDLITVNEDHIPNDRDEFDDRSSGPKGDPVIVDKYPIPNNRDEFDY